MSDPEVKTMYRAGYTDGYTHSHNGPFYKTYAEADAISKVENGSYAVEPKAFSVIEISNGRVYIVDGPYHTGSSFEALKAVRKAALMKLTPAEREALGLKEDM